MTQNLIEEMTEAVSDVEASAGEVVGNWLVEAENSKRYTFHQVSIHPADHFCAADEEKDYEYIRRTYLPELLLNYHNALYYASYCLSKPNLLTQCMSLSIWVASKPHVTRSFTESRRMAELVDALALSAKAMVVTNLPRDRHLDQGQLPGIWNVGKADGDDGETPFPQQGQ